MRRIKQGVGQVSREDHAQGAHFTVTFASERGESGGQGLGSRRPLSVAPLWADPNRQPSPTVRLKQELSPPGNKDR